MDPTEHPDPDQYLEETDELAEEDILQVIDVDEDMTEEDLTGILGDLEVDNDDMPDDEMEDGSSSGATSAPERDDSALTFTQHTGQIFVTAVDPLNSSLVVTGGEDDVAYVWDVKNGDVLFKCEGHKDSVTCASFSHDSVYIATADMSGLIKVWKVETHEEIWSFEVGDLEWLQWHHGSHVLLVGGADGDTWMWMIPSGVCKTYQGHGCVCTVGKFLPTGKHACTGYEDGTVKVWDLKAGQASQTFSEKTGHEGSVTCIDCHRDGIVVLTGATDTTAKLLNTSTGKVLASFDCSTTSNEEKKENLEDSVEAVGFSPLQSFAATGTLSGMLTLWDVPNQMARHHCKHETGIVRLQWDPSAPVVYTCCLDGTVNLWDSRNGKREGQWLGHSGTILDMDLARDGSLLVTGSEDRTAKIFSIHSPDR